ncbi:collagen-like protein [Aquimarina pacifica]|uniref:collagen-like protein n=1 Tax=Aquimarina pacifica TaxID=1296415 RepID=UPI000471E253|nr:collagen-like protein [Aquimarina pacifica]
MKNKYVRILLICCLGIFLANCEAEDGEPGEAGQFGLSGTNGADGENGVNGLDGLGFDELLKYGGITMTFDGTRSDGLEFTEVREFKYLPSESAGDYNYVEIDEDEETDYKEFYIERFLGNPDDTDYYGTLADLYFEIEDAGEETESMYFELELEGFSLVFDDLTFIEFTEYDYYETGDSDISELEITNYSFDDETNQFTLSISAIMDTDSSDDFDSLTVTIDIDIVVFEYVDGGFRR